MTPYHVSIRTDSVHAPLPQVRTVQHHLLQAIAEALPDVTASSLAVRLFPDRHAAIFRITIHTGVTLTPEMWSSMKVGALAVRLSVLEIRALPELELSPPDHGEPCKAA